MARLLYDLTGLLHWYAYFGRPAGVQRVVEQVGGCPLLQQAARRSGSQQERVEFVVRLLGSDRFYRLDPGLLTALGDRRSATVARLRRLFAQSLRLATPGGLLAAGRYFHVPYIALGLSRLERSIERGGALGDLDSSLRPVEPPGQGDTLFNPGDLWWQKDYVAALAGLKQRTGVRIVQMVHDLYVLERPDWSPRGFSRVFGRQLQGIAPLVDRWLTSSHHVEGQVGRHLQEWGVPARPITVLPMGWDSFDRAPIVGPAGDQAMLERHGIAGRPFILFVGTIEPRKNVPALLDAMDSLRRRLGDRAPTLVVAGGYGWRAPEVRARLRQGMRDGHLLWMTNLSDGDLGALYRGARFTVMPSHGEGWGLAVQESIALGVPCIASFGGATREAGLDLAAYFDPARPAELESAMMTWIVDEGALADARARIARALESENFPSWNDAGKVLLAQAAWLGDQDSNLD